MGMLSALEDVNAGHEASGLQSSAELGVQNDQSAGQTVTDSAGLAGNAAAVQRRTYDGQCRKNTSSCSRTF